MLCTVVNGPTIKDIYNQVERAFARSDLIELRLDLFKNISVQNIVELRLSFSIPMIFTFKGNVSLDFLDLNPEFVDFDYRLFNIKNFAVKYPKTKLILSFHDFDKTPRDLNFIFKNMKKTSADYYKIATKTNSSLDAFRLLLFAKENGIIISGMGRAGHLTRVLGPIFNVPITYACLDKPIVFGQVPLDELFNTYNYSNLNVLTNIYGLIGYPIDKSISYVTYNKLICEQKQNGVYVTIPIRPEELIEFFILAKQINFKGLSVTMPLKEEVLQYIDEIDSLVREIGACNTLKFYKNKIYGYNTDADGVLKALLAKTSIKNKNILILGAGGAAKAIAYILQKNGASLIILNRTKKRAVDLSKQLGCMGNSLENISNYQNYDIIINCTSQLSPINSKWILEKSIVMDINTIPRETAFIKEAIKKQCAVVYGFDMFINQAIAQVNVWSNHG